MPAAPIHHTSTVDTTWDANEAVSAMPNDKATLHYCHAWETDDAGDEKADYHFPHHEKKGGPANLHAVRNGLAQLPKATTVDDKDGIKAHLQAHLDDAEKKASARADRFGAITALLARVKRPEAKARPEARQPYEIRAAAPETAEVWLYDEIGGWGVWAESFVRDLAQIDADEITVRLNSPGGDFFDGIAISNALMAHPATITIRVDGLAASIASVIALAGDRVVMGRGAQMMIHNASTMAFGQASDLRQCADLLDKISGVIAGAYADRTGTPVEAWAEAMNAETWYTADEAVAAGLADEVAPIPEREQHGHDPDEAVDSIVPGSDDDGALSERAAASTSQVVHAAREGVVPSPRGVDVSAGVLTERVSAHAGRPVAALAEPEPDGEPDGDGEGGYDAKLLGQVLGWALAVDQHVDRLIAECAQALGIPNPDVDNDAPPPPLPKGDAGIAYALGMFTAVDTVVDGAQCVLACALGIPNPDPDEDDDEDEPDGDGPHMTAGTPAVTASLEGGTGGGNAPIDSPDTGAAPADDWSAITAHLTAAPADPDDVLAALRGALL